MGAGFSEGMKTARAARILFGVALLASAALLLHYRLDIGFVADDWAFLRDRSLGGLDSLLIPENENIVILQAAVYRIFYILFGIQSSASLQIASLVFFLLSVVAFYAWIRERVGEWAAAIASIPILFLGTAYQDLLWAFQMGYTVSILAGLTALIALERNARFSQPVALVAILVSVTTSSLGLPFLAGAAVILVSRDGWEGLFNYVLLAPFLVFLVWWVGWGRTADSHLSLTNLLHAPAFVAESVKSVVMGLTGLHRTDSVAGDVLAWVISGALFAAVSFSLIRRKRLPLPLLVALAVGLAFWVLTAANQAPGMFTREADQSRYQYPGAVFLLMILAGAFDGYRPGRNWLTGLASLAAVSVACSLGTLSEGRKILIDISVTPKASLTAMDIAGEEAIPGYQVRLTPYLPIFMSQQRFREVEERYGRAGWSEEQIADQSDEVRRLVDAELVAALGIVPRPGRAGGSSGCRTVKLNPAGSEIASVSAGTLSIAPARSDAALALGRFADQATFAIGTAKAGRSTTVDLPAGQSSQPWRVRASGTGKAQVCVS